MSGKQRENHEREQGEIVFKEEESLELVSLKVTDDSGERFWQSLMGTGSKRKMRRLKMMSVDNSR